MNNLSRKPALDGFFILEENECRSLYKPKHRYERTRAHNLSLLVLFRKRANYLEQFILNEGGKGQHVRKFGEEMVRRAYVLRL